MSREFRQDVGRVTGSQSEIAFSIVKPTPENSHAEAYFVAGETLTSVRAGVVSRSGPSVHWVNQPLTYSRPFTSSCHERTHAYLASSLANKYPFLAHTLVHWVAGLTGSRAGFPAPVQELFNRAYLRHHFPAAYISFLEQYGYDLLRAFAADDANRLASIFQAAGIPLPPDAVLISKEEAKQLQRIWQLSEDETRDLPPLELMRIKESVAVP